MKKLKLTAEERRLMTSIDKGEWRALGPEAVARYTAMARAARKDRRLNIRLSPHDLAAIQDRALADGLPYQTLIASVLHKYAAGRLKEVE